MKGIRIGIVFLLSVALFGCATIFTGTTDKIHFGSNVDPVKVYVDGLYVGDTPLTVPVDRKIGEGSLVSFRKDGYETQEFKLRNKFNWVAVFDISSIIVSGGIDVLSGAIMEYSPKQYHVEMVKKDTNPENEALQSKQVQFANFVLVNASDIQRDLAVGDGPALKNLIVLVSAGGSPYKFSKWLGDNTQSLLAAKNPEDLLSKLRASGLTP